MEAVDLSRQQQIQSRAVDYLAQAFSAASSGAPALYGPDNRPLPPARFHWSRKAAGSQGSLRNWQPRRLLNDQQVVRERETIQARISDLVGSDPHAAGVVNSFPQTVIGSGLTPYPNIDEQVLGISRDEADALERAQRLVYSRWHPHADVSGRMHFGQIQYVWEKSLIQYGESLTLVHMRKRPGRKYRLCLRTLNPMRIKTPTDKRKNGNIYDGIEINRLGEPLYAWIKISEPGKTLSDTSKNFVQVPFKRGHRWMVLHDFITDDPEQYRGVSPLASCIKGFKDLSDFLNAELVSNVVTAAFALFIEMQAGQNPIDLGRDMSSFYDAERGAAGQEKKTYFQELNPGSIYYGNTGEKPHPISANRPGTTFEPFVREIKKAFSHGLGVPYPVLFKDVDGVSHAGFRSAMLEAWRVYTFRRKHIGGGPSQKTYNMLMEEAHLNGDLPVPGGTTRFYEDQDALCAAQWAGPPKGDIEPYKQVKADQLKWEGNQKTLEQIILEDGGGNPAAVIRQVEKEKKDLAARGIYAAGQQQKNDSELAGGEASAESVAEAVADKMEERNGS